ncbi:MAG: 1-acyl-sn-glycerol-3-phosphate acyltransferase [Ignavibacteriae bacterium]|nr:MAG: 1-acyl-sn-glycerol-3-phosphate acyltransferase [Ignavibacteriota bacterium]
MWLVKNLLFAIISIVIAILTLIFKPVNIKGKPINLLMKLWCNITLLIYGVKVNVYGRENIKDGSGKVYISNHSSYLDIFVLLAKVPDNVRIIYKKELNKIPLFGCAMLAAEFVPINRENIREAMQALDKAAQKIRKGISFVIFPEGTRSPDGTVQDFKRGMFVLTEKAQVQIIPISLSNTFNLMGHDSLRIISGTVNLVIGEPLQPKKDKAFLNEVRELVIKNIKPV